MSFSLKKEKKKPEKFRTLALEQNIYTVVQTDITAGVVFKKKKKVIKAKIKLYLCLLGARTLCGMC